MEAILVASKLGAPRNYSTIRARTRGRAAMVIFVFRRRFRACGREGKIHFSALPSDEFEQSFQRFSENECWRVQHRTKTDRRRRRRLLERESNGNRQFMSLFLVEVLTILQWMSGSARVSETIASSKHVQRAVLANEQFRKEDT